MTEFLNPRGRVLKFLSPDADKDEIIHETIGFGLATLRELEKYFSSRKAAARKHAENPALEVFQCERLIGRCELVVSAYMSSDLDLLEDGDAEELHYFVHFKDVRVDKKFRGEGIGRRLTACAARYSASVIAEDMLQKEVRTINVCFNAELVSEAGEALYRQLVESVVNQLEHFGVRFDKEIIFIDEGSW